MRALSKIARVVGIKTGNLFFGGTKDKRGSTV